MKCSECGTELSEGVFCPKCGKLCQEKPIKEQQKNSAEKERLEKEKLEAEVALAKEQAAIAKIERQKAEEAYKSEMQEKAKEKRDAQAPKTNAVFSLVFGIIALLTCGGFIFPEVLGIVFSLKSKNKNDKKMHNYGKAGLICSCTSIIFMVALIIISIITEPDIKYVQYNSALDLLNSEKYEEAISAFKELDGYKDSNEQIINCENAIKDGKYDSAMDLYNAGKYGDAISAFEALNGYKDSSEQIENCWVGKYGEEKWNKIKNIKVGDTYTFGSYEQDNNTSNGKEAIKWIVLEKNGMSLLLVSEYALDCQEYNESKTNETWETCSLRKWMNDTFIKNAFSADEQAIIQNTNVPADDNSEFPHDPNPCNDTIDKVFLLSITEAKKYFSSDESRKCIPTAYTIALGAETYNEYTKDGKATCWWWLRSPGLFLKDSAGVSYSGVIDFYGYGSAPIIEDYNILFCVRPAMWISLD